MAIVPPVSSATRVQKRFMVLLLWFRVRSPTLTRAGTVGGLVRPARINSNASALNSSAGDRGADRRVLGSRLGADDRGEAPAEAGWSSMLKVWIRLTRSMPECPRRSRDSIGRAGRVTAQHAEAATQVVDQRNGASFPRWGGLALSHGNQGEHLETQCVSPFTGARKGATE